MPGFPNGTTPSAPAHPTRTETGNYSCAGPYVQLEGVKSGASDESQKLRGVAGIVFHPFEEQPGAPRFDVKLEGSGARDGTDANTGELMSQVTAAF